MSEPDPKLFTELPTALQPAPTKPGDLRRSPLEGLDRAQAGMTTADFVTGGKPGAVRPPVAIAQRAPSAGNGNRGGLQVEVIRGDRSETIRY
jgi:pilus assembly protein CpaB